MSGLLLDTNIPSELNRPRPDPLVAEWLDQQDDNELFLSVVTLGEIRKGYTVLPHGKRRTFLEHWFESHLLPWFEGRILPVTHAIADKWGVLAGEAQLRGNPLNTADGLIAATALEHDLVVVTRNVKDFARLGVAIINPWEQGITGRTAT